MKRNKKSLPFSIICLALSSIIVVPLLLMILGSFQTAAEAQRFRIALPENWLFSNYAYVYRAGRIANAFKNSIIIAVGVVGISVTFSSFSAFVISRRMGRSSKILYYTFLLGMVAPIQVITTFGLLRITNLLGTHLGVILVISAMQIPWCVFIFSGFINSVPRSLDEAAYIDGANVWQLFFKIILPVLKPVVATCIVTTSMAAWNEFMIPLYFLNTSERWTLPLTVFNFFGRYGSSWQYVFANLTMTAVPITILYVYCQKYIIKGLTAGSVKG